MAMQDSKMVMEFEEAGWTVTVTRGSNRSNHYTCITPDGKYECGSVYTAYAKQKDGGDAGMGKGFRVVRGKDGESEKSGEGGEEGGGSKKRARLPSSECHSGHGLRQQEHTEQAGVTDKSDEQLAKRVCHTGSSGSGGGGSSGGGVGGDGSSSDRGNNSDGGGGYGDDGGGGSGEGEGSPSAAAAVVVGSDEGEDGDDTEEVSDLDTETNEGGPENMDEQDGESAEEVPVAASPPPVIDLTADTSSDSDENDSDYGNGDCGDGGDRSAGSGGDSGGGGGGSGNDSSRPKRSRKRKQHAGMVRFENDGGVAD